MTTLAWAEISLASATHNLQVAKMAAPTSRVMAVIKANGYGHGATRMAEAFINADAFAVARIAEAIELRKAGIDKPITVLSGTSDAEDLVACSQYSLEPVIHNLETCQLLNSLQLSLPGLWLKADTGMHRLGLDPDDVDKALQLLQPLYGNLNTGLMSHLASSEEPENPSNPLQHIQFEHLATSRGFAGRSLCNSGGILHHPDMHYEWVRPGIMLYGSNPGIIENAFTAQLKAVMTLKSRVIKTRNIKPGERVGYNGIWQAGRESTIATIAIGYADGYPRHAPNGTPVLINGRYWPLVGRVSMDLITVDVTGGNINTGDEAILWGEGLSANEIARHAQTISYELFTSVTTRVERFYI